MIFKGASNEGMICTVLEISMRYSTCRLMGKKKPVGHCPGRHQRPYTTSRKTIIHAEFQSYVHWCNMDKMVLYY